MAVFRDATADVAVKPFTGSPGEWDNFLGEHPGSAFAHRHDWLTLIEQTYGGQPLRLAAYQSGRLVGLLPLMLRRRVIGAGNILVSVPFADEGGLLADDPQAQAALLEHARATASDLGAGYVELRQLSALAAQFPVDASRVTLKLALPATADELWTGLKAKVRNQVRKAERSGLQAAHSTDLASDLGAFYAVYSHNTRDLGSPMHAAAFFHNLTKAFPDDLVLVRIVLGELTVGAALAVTHHGVFSVPWAASLRSHFSLCPNNLLYWELMRAALSRGCSVFDFGRSAPDSGTYAFKRQWGAEEFALHYTFIPLTKQPSLGEKREGPAYRMFSRLWRQTPLAVARLVGPRLFARLPL